MRVRLRRGDGLVGSRERPPVARSPEAYQEPPGAAKAKRKRHLVSLGGPRGTLVRQSCPTDEGPLPLRPRPGRRPALSCSGRRRAQPRAQRGLPPPGGYLPGSPRLIRPSGVPWRWRC